MSYTGLTSVGVFCGSSQVLPAGTSLTGTAHRRDRCRLVGLELLFRYVLESMKVVVGSKGQ
jgi:hypothetical protein